MALVPVHHRHRVVQRGAAVPASLHLSPCVFMSGSAIIRSHPSARLVSSINLVHLLSRSRVSVTVPRSDRQATRTPINTLARARAHTHTHTHTHIHTHTYTTSIAHECPRELCRCVHLCFAYCLFAAIVHFKLFVFRTGRFVTSKQIQNL